MMLTLDFFLSCKKKKMNLSGKVELSDQDLSTAVKLHCQTCNKF